MWYINSCLLDIWSCPFTRQSPAFVCLFVCFLFVFWRRWFNCVLGFNGICSLLSFNWTCTALWASGWLLTEGFSALEMYSLLLLLLLLYWKVSHSYFMVGHDFYHSLTLYRISLVWLLLTHGNTLSFICCVASNSVLSVTFLFCFFALISNCGTTPVLLIRCDVIAF